MRCLACRLTGIVAAGVLLTGVPSGRADALRTFAISGLFRSGAVMSGTLTIDEDAGRVLSCDIRVSGASTVIFERVAKQTVVGLAAVVVLAPEGEDWPRLVLGERTFPGSLRHYAGGPLGRRTDIVHRDQSRQMILSGHLVAAATPSP